MNVFRTVSRLLIVMAVVFVGNVCAMVFDNNKFAYIGSFAAEQTFNKNDHAKKALIATLGNACDINATRRIKFLNNKIDNKITKENIFVASTPIEFASHFAINYGIRKSGEMLNAKGISLDAVAEKCDVLPESVKAYANPMVRAVAEVATHEETLTLIVLWLLPSQK